MRWATAGGSAPDPFTLLPFSTFRSHASIIGKVVVDPRLVAGESTAVFVTGGQSMSSNTVDTPYTPTNATKVDQINVHDGGTYRAVDPLLGCEIDTTGNTGTVWSRLGDKLIDGGVFQRVIFIPVGLGGTSADDWNSNQALYNRLVVAGRRAAAVGLPVTGFLWAQGERDGVLGTAQAAWQASTSGIIAKVRAAGFGAPWFIAKSTYQAGATSATIRAAQAAMVNGTDIFAGPDTDTLTGTSVNRQADNTHFKAAGADAAAALWKTAIDAVL
jgi:hypothetical protein